jgi:hypothetical protein
MKDIKELIYAAVEENAVKFQELVNAQLQVRAYDAIEALRPEIGASMFGEAKKMEDDEEDMEDDEEDEDEEMEDEDEMDDKKKSMKEALHPNQQKIDVVDDEKIDAKDFAKLRQMKKMKEAVNVLMKDKDSTALRYPKGHSPQGDQHRAMAAKAAKTARAAGSLKGSDRSTWKRPGQSVTSGGVSAARPAKPLGEEEAVADKVRTRGSVKFFSKKKLPGSDKSSMNEVAMPQNQADWQAMINHQIKIADHPVATDAQFRATNGKDKTKIASLEPGEDMLQYATAQGGTVKR